MAKVFKNAGTILEKVRNGELAFAGSSLYTGMKFKKRKDILAPYLHSLDDYSLAKAMSSFMCSDASHHPLLMKLLADYTEKRIQVDLGTAYSDIRDIWYEFPPELVNDIFNLNFQDIEKIAFSTRSDANRMRYSIIEKANLSTSKVTTRYNHIKSMLYTRAIIQYYVIMLAMTKQITPLDFKDLMESLKSDPTIADQLAEKQPAQPAPVEENNEGENEDEGDQENADDSSTPATGKTTVKMAGQGITQDDANKDLGEGDEDESSSTPTVESSVNHHAHSSNPAQSNKGGDVKKDTATHLENLLTAFEANTSGQAVLDAVLENAKDTAEKITDILSEDEMEAMWEDMRGNYQDAEKANLRLNSNHLAEIEDTLKKVSMNLSGIKSTIQALLDKSASYFSAKDIPYYENLFDSGNIANFQDFELFHPILRKISVDDMDVKEVRKAGKIDIYIDCSGSMSDPCNVQNADGSRMTRLLFAKSFVYKMKQLNMLNMVYSFQNQVTKEGTSTIDILSMTDGGGTNLEKVVQHIIKTDKNAIVITDAYGDCEQYTEKAFFIGIEGADFSNFTRAYQKNKQLIVFDGKQIMQVDERGRAIKKM